MGVPSEDYDKVSHIKHSRMQLMLKAAKGEITDEELCAKAVELNIKAEDARKEHADIIKSRQEGETAEKGAEDKPEKPAEENKEEDKDSDKDVDGDK